MCYFDLTLLHDQDYKRKIEKKKKKFKFIIYFLEVLEVFKPLLVEKT